MFLYCGKWKLPFSTDELRKYLADENEKVRAVAEWALMELWWWRSVEEVVDILNSPDRELQDMGKRLVEIRRHGSVVQVLRKMLNSENGEVRKKAATYLEDIGVRGQAVSAEGKGKE